MRERASLTLRVVNEVGLSELTVARGLERARYRFEVDKAGKTFHALALWAEAELG